MCPDGCSCAGSGSAGRAMSCTWGLFGPSRTAELLFYLLSPLLCEQWLHWPRNPPSQARSPESRGCHCAAEGPRVGAAAGVSCWGARLGRPGGSRL